MFAKIGYCSSMTARFVSQAVLGTDDRREYSQSEACPESGWFIVASRQDEEVVHHLLAQAPVNAVKIERIIWVDSGPVKLYHCLEDLWQDLFAS